LFYIRFGVPPFVQVTPDGLAKYQIYALLDDSGVQESDQPFASSQDSRLASDSVGFPVSADSGHDVFTVNHPPRRPLS